MKKNVVTDSVLHKYRLKKMLMIMKLCIVLTFGFLLNLNASVFSQHKINMQLGKVGYKQVFTEITKQTGLTFMYSDSGLKSDKKIVANFKNVELKDVLKSILKGSDMTYLMQDEFVVIMPKAKLSAKQQQKNEIKGKVVDEKGKPMPGVTVQLEGVSMGTATDIDGNFKIDLPVKKGVLVFSFVGFKTQKVAFVAGKDIKVKMQVERSNLDEVQVTAYGTTTRRKSTSAISTVKGEDLKGVPTADLSTLLQGKVAGLEISTVSGAPGGGGTFTTLRGFNSMLVNQGSRGSEPLWVVDGIPMPNITSPVTGTNALSEIDPNSIESVEVLKDAASCALYGSRGANGVILITTKKGRKGTTKFSVNCSRTFSWVPEYPTVIGGKLEREYRTAMNRNARRAGLNIFTGEYIYPQSYYDRHTLMMSGYDLFWDMTERDEVKYGLQDSLNSFYNNSSDWFKYYFQTGTVTNGNLQATGGSERFMYNVGVNYYDEEGIMIGTGFSKVNFLSNITMKPIRNLTVNVRTSFTTSDKQKMDSPENAYGGNVYREIEKIPGNPFSLSSLLPSSGGAHDDALGRLQLTKKIFENHSFRNSLDLQYRAAKNLIIRSALSYSFIEANSNVYTPAVLDEYGEAKSQGVVNRSTMLLSESTMSYNLKINENHNFDFMAGLTYQKDELRIWDGTAKGSPSDYIEYASFGLPGLLDRNGNMVAAQTFISDFAEKIMTSYLGRVNYNYMGKYILGATIRRDGSSTFGHDVKWANFPSFSTGWVFSEENFMESLSWLDFGKLRSSWGRTGQVFSDPYLSYGLLQLSNVFMGKAGVSPKWGDGLYNPTLTWEKTDQYDIGLDLDVFNYRANITLDYYLRQTRGMLYKTEVLGDFYSYDKYWRNACGIDNEGLELLVKVDVLRDSKLKWTSSVNVARNWNRFVESFNGKDIIGNNNFIIGKRLFQIQGKATNGFYNSDDEVPYVYNSSYQKQRLVKDYNSQDFYIGGDVRYVDQNGDNRIDNNDNISLGSSLPKIHGGIVNNLKYKGFELNVQTVFSLGRNIINGAYNSLSSAGQNSPLRIDPRSVNFWDGQGGNYDMAKVAYDYNRGNFDLRADKYVETVNYLKLKSVNLTYDLPESVCKKCHVSGLRLLLSANNLFTWTNYSGSDPESVLQTTGYDNANTYPMPRQITLGLTVNL